MRINYKGVDVFECPPNSQGFVMLQALNILEGMNVRYMRHNSAPYLHAVTESLKPQRRFGHLFSPELKTEVNARIQAIADRNRRRYRLVDA